MATLLRIFFPDILDILDSTTRAIFLGDAIEHLVLLLESFQLFIQFIFILLIMFHSISPTAHRSYHSILDGPVGMHARAVLSTMQHIIFIRHSCLLAKHAIGLGPMVIV